MEAISRGAEVFKNTGCTGSIDMVLRVGDEFVPVDVKLDSWSATRGYWQSNGVTADGVYHVRVNPETGACSWLKQRGGDASKARYQCPEGLEGFWE